jgi:hypothetical protein
VGNESEKDVGSYFACFSNAELLLTQSFFSYTIANSPTSYYPLLMIFHYSYLPPLLDQGIASEAHSLIVQKIYARNHWVFHLLCVQGLMQGRFFSILFDKCTLELSIKSTIYGVRVPGLGETEHNMLNKARISTKGKSQVSKPRNPPK